MRMTNNPITQPQQSPAPTGKRLDSLDPKAADYQLEKSKILNHPNYSTSKMVTLEPGLNDFKNEEHAEYFFKQLGNPEDGGVRPMGNKTVKVITNKNFVWEVEAVDKPEKGESAYKTVKGPWFEKYRQPDGVVMHTTADPSQFQIQS